MIEFSVNNYLGELDNCSYLEHINKIKEGLTKYFDDIVSIAHFDNFDNILTKMAISWFEYGIDILKYFDETSYQDFFVNNFIRKTKIKSILYDNFIDLEIERFYILIKKVVFKIVFEQFIEKKKPKVILVDKLDYIHLMKLANSKTILVYNDNCGIKEETIVKFNVRVINYKHYHKNKPPQTYANIIKVTKQIREADVSLVDLRLIYIDKEFYPSYDDIIIFLNSFKNIEQIIMPLLDNDEEIFLNCNKGIAVSSYHYYSKHFNLIIKALKGYVDKSKFVNIPISKFNDYYYFWRELVKVAINDEVKVGITLSDYRDIYGIDNFEYIDNCLIFFDEIVKNLKISNLDYNKFKNNLLLGMRDIISILRSRSVCYVIHTHSLTNYEIIEKILYIGYRNFSVSGNNYYELKETANKFLEKKQKYN